MKLSFYELVIPLDLSAQLLIFYKPYPCSSSKLTHSLLIKYHIEGLEIKNFILMDIEFYAKKNIFHGRPTRNGL